MTIAVIDGDIVCYRCAASAEKDDQQVALIRASRLLQDIISETGADEIKLFLSGSENFRYQIYPEYKANRRDLPRPQHLQAVREFLVLKWGADVTDGYEADDAIGVVCSETSGSVCASIDKDLLQLPGEHYNFVTRQFQTVDVLDGWRNFYQQLILGDKADNIPGFDGKSRVKWPKFLEQSRLALLAAQSSYEMYLVVRGLYTSVNQELLERNAKVLYLWRKLNDQWSPPESPSSDAKPETAEKSASTLTMQEGTTRSTGPTGMKQTSDGSSRVGRKKATSKTKRRRAGST